MKPDPKKQRDKARLDRKKEAGRAARAARKEARAVEADPLRAPATAGLIDAVRHQRGERRRRSFLELCAIDQNVGLALVMELLDDATGQNREELGRLLLWRGGDQHVDFVIAGHAGEVVVAGFAGSDVVVDAARRLLPEVPRLAPIELLARLRRLGVAPLVDGALEGIGARDALGALLSAALHHPRRDEFSSSDRDVLVDALLRASPDTLWTRCRDVLDASTRRDPRLQLAALAARVDLDDAAALITWLQALRPDERSRRLQDAGLPDSARRLDTAAAAALWRLCVLDEAMPVASRQEAARHLWTREGTDAAGTLLLHPALAIDVTVALSRALAFDEFHDAVAATFATSVALRDALLETPMARHPALLADLRALVRTDPLGFAAYAVRSEAPQAVDELLQAIERADDNDDAGWLLLGALTTQPLSTLRGQDLGLLVSRTLTRTEGGVDVVAGLQALRRFLPRAGALTVEVDGAIERIVRRFTLAR